MASAEREPITGVWRRSDRTDSPTPTPVKTRRICINFRSDLWQKWGGHVHPSPPGGDATEPDARQAISSYNSWRTMASRYCVVVIGG